MEVAGLRVGNREIRWEIDIGSAVFTGAMQGLGHQFTMPIQPTPQPGNADTYTADIYGGIGNADYNAGSVSQDALLQMASVDKGTGPKQGPRRVNLSNFRPLEL